MPNGHAPKATGQSRCHPHSPLLLRTWFGQHVCCNGSSGQTPVAGQSTGADQGADAVHVPADRPAHPELAIAPSNIPRKRHLSSFFHAPGTSLSGSRASRGRRSRWRRRCAGRPGRPQEVKVLPCEEDARVSPARKMRLTIGPGISRIPPRRIPRNFGGPVGLNPHRWRAVRRGRSVCRNRSAGFQDFRIFRKRPP